jgi:hypothetical protein
MPSTSSPSMRMVTVSTVSNWVRVATTWATRSCMERLPPPDWKAAFRSTVATPSAMSTPSTSVPAGTALENPMPDSVSLGPASTASRAAAPTPSPVTVRAEAASFSSRTK